MANSFNGDSLIVTLAAGVTSVDVLTVYKDWKNWILAGGNLGYPPAFRSDGGNPLSSIINQGSYIFLNNSAGWRIKPPEENITVYLTGNLAVEDTALPAFIPTTGSFTAAILGLQPVTQGVTPVMAAQLSFASYDNGVSIDVANGVSGTASPIGSLSNPVNNLDDAKTIAAARGFDHLYIKGNLTIGAAEDISGYEVYGDGASINVPKTTITMTPGCITQNTFIYNAKVLGTQGGEVIYTDCVIGNIAQTHCQFIRCALVGPIKLYLSDSGELPAPSWLNLHTTDLNECHTSYSQLVVDYNHSPMHQVYSNFTGRIKITNLTDADTSIVFRCVGAEIELDATCTAGTIKIRGSAVVKDYAGIGVVRDFDGVTSTRATVAADVWAKTLDGLTAEEIMRLALAALAGKRSGIGTATETYYAPDGTTPRITLTPDALGNGQPVITP